MRTGIAITVDGVPRAINLDMVHSIQKDKDGKAEICFPSGVSFSADQAFEAVIARLVFADVVVDCRNSAKPGETIEPPMRKSNQ